MRELSNVVERLVILSGGELVGPELLPPNLPAAARPEPAAALPPVSLADVERVHIARTLAQTGGRKLQTARLLGIDIKTLNKKIRDYGILPGPPA